MDQAALTKHEITYKELTDPRWYGTFIPNEYLRSWGFDLNREIAYWYDAYKERLILVRNKNDSAIDESVIPEATPFLDRKFRISYSTIIAVLCVVILDVLQPYDADFVRVFRGFVFLVLIIVFVRQVVLFIWDLFNLIRKRRKLHVND